ncbi:MAG: hypothetical protein JJ953_06665 [Gracilimonas sp.]|uniref:hypothetical protein n=1 Tax=Gracilimonas TaxID=649462 RepID=UPI001B295B68|nr:hypothetical protein [Gracilimonas sp.]MBO6585770.1 hypothetical protein [Gracilimonas sp.]MBO6616767.1 hypothetical protein [Gracilimonas sp.]
MRKLSSILILLLLTSAGSKAQTLSSFSNEIFKEANSEVYDPGEITLSDFSYRSAYTNQQSTFLELPRTKPFVAFTASAIIPGSGQAANGKWVRAGIYFAVEAVGIIYHLDRNATARRQEKAYEEFTHQNWSVLAYAEWLVNYSMQNNLNNGWQDLQSHIAGKNPDFTNTTNDWSKVNINLLHQVEQETPFVFENRYGSEFSHLLPDYGSQQYYELISKYYQYQPGWRDWYGQVTTANNQTPDMYRYMWNGRDEPFTLFYQGRDRAQKFNDNYRAAGNILKLLVVNHVVSAFDALFTVQLKNSRIETNTNLMKMEQFSVTWHF